MVSVPSLSNVHVRFPPQVPSATTSAEKALIGSKVKIITATNAKHKIRFFMLLPFPCVNSIIFP